MDNHFKASRSLIRMMHMHQPLFPSLFWIILHYAFQTLHNLLLFWQLHARWVSCLMRTMKLRWLPACIFFCCYWDPIMLSLVSVNEILPSLSSGSIGRSTKGLGRMIAHFNVNFECQWTHSKSCLRWYGKTLKWMKPWHLCVEVQSFQKFACMLHFAGLQEGHTSI